MKKSGKTIASISKDPAERFALRRLLSVLNGHPGAMIEIIPRLEGQSAAAVLQEFEEGR